MASKIKQTLTKNFYDTIRPKFHNKSYEDVFQLFKLKRNKDNKILWKVNIPQQENGLIDLNVMKNSQKELIENQTISNITCYESRGQSFMEIQLQVIPFIQDVLNLNPASLNFKPDKKKVLIEFSSPNIAKPFHVGHLRSTMIGNFMANLKKKLGKNVVRINYLGDWGTQFGMIKLGVEHLNYSIDKLKRDPINMLYKAYVTGNALAEKDDELYEKALKIFHNLENNDQETIESWNLYRNWTMEELNKVYARLGVHFDEYDWESNYKRNKANGILKMLKQKGLLSVDEKGRQVALIENQVIPLIKSDNSTLYLLRDLMAVAERKSKHNFHELYYVVENGQSNHFITLLRLCKELNLSDNVKIQHVIFGKIHGMSTRRGKVVFLKDVLDEARERAFKKQEESKTTKAFLDNKDIADVLGVTAVVVNDLKHKRKNDYAVSWEEMLQINGNTGNYLQYCNCRLSSLLSNSNCSIASECDPTAFQESEAIDLIVEMAKYENVLLKADMEIESSILVNYLFNLVSSINSALRVLKVKNSDPYLASQRLLLFHKSQKVLEDGLKLLGLKPLKAM